MEPTLIAVTLLSLAMAVAMGGVAWRLLREERHRSDARVAALAALANREPSMREVTDRSPERPAGRRPVAAAVPPPAPGRRAAHRATAPVGPFDLPLRPAVWAAQDAGTDARAAAALFASPAADRQGGRRALALALVAVVMSAGLGALWLLGGGSRAGASDGTAPIELVSLGHDRQGDTLRIAGLVQNPRNAGERRDVVAVASLFDAAGALVASGNAPLDFTRLAPGEESPFVIVVMNAHAVVRYRLGFRSRDGRVLAHVDRRAEPTSADTGGARGPQPATMSASATRARD